MSTLNGWPDSAAAWLAEMRPGGDFGRLHVLDGPMLARIRNRGFRTALDVGCGEGRFCRMLAAQDIAPIGIEPCRELLAAARERDPAGRYVEAMAETLPFGDAAFDLVVSYLTLMDIDGLDAAVVEMARVLRPGGSLLVANLTGFWTSGSWQSDPAGERFVMDDYLTERAEWVSWSGITIRNWHRPLQRYMSVPLAAGLSLVHFEEPAPAGGDPEASERYCRVPCFTVTEWEKR